MTELRLTPSRSRLAVRTRAAGVFARLAHDLEIVAADLRGHARLDGDGWSAELQIPVAGLQVAGTLHGDRLDPGALSASDRAEIERRVRHEVLAGTDEIRVRASGASRDRADAVHVALARASAATTARLEATERADGIEVTGSCWLSLRALGIPEIKGPLGAFKIADTIEIRLSVTLQRGA